jgi:RND family efflux transporter MFP subunit
MIKFSVYIVGMFFLTGCLGEKVVLQKIEEAKVVKIMTVESSHIDNIRFFPGIVESYKSAILSFKVSGTLNSLPITPGKRLVKGDLMASLDDADFKVNYTRAESVFELAQSDLNRMMELDKSSLISKSQLDIVKANFKSAKADLQVSKNELAYTRLYAPFDLTTAAVYVENFEQVMAAKPIVTIQNLEFFNVSIQVPQNLMAAVEDKVFSYQPEVSFDANPKLKYKAKLTEWVTNTNGFSDTFKVLFTLPAPEDINLLPGMTAKVKVDLKKVIKTKENSILIPLSAVFSAEALETGKGYVWIVTIDQKLNRRQVNLGKIYQTNIVVLSGLSAGEKLVTAGVERLNDGMLVSEWQPERGL